MILISSCNQKSKKLSENKQIANTEKLQLDSVPTDSDYTIDASDTVDAGVFFMVVEEMPQFGNGLEDIKKYFLDNIEYHVFQVSSLACSQKL